MQMRFLSRRTELLIYKVLLSAPSVSMLNALCAYGIFCDWDNVGRSWSAVVVCTNTLESGVWSPKSVNWAVESGTSAVFNSTQ